MGRFATTVALYEELRPPYPPAFFRTVAQRLGLGREHALIDQQTERSELVVFTHRGNLELWWQPHFLFESQGQAIATMTSFIIYLARKAAHKMDAKITNLRILERAR